MLTFETERALVARARRRLVDRRARSGPARDGDGSRRDRTRAGRTDPARRAHTPRSAPG